MKATKNGSPLYYEVKDSSSEITTSYEKHGAIYFDPMDDQKVEQWIKEKTEDADRRGANFLICRVPVWSGKFADENEFYGDWGNRIMKQHFLTKKRIGPQEFLVRPTFRIASHVQGVYILKKFGHIRISFDA
jgi:hypothetical protein